VSFGPHRRKPGDIVAQMMTFSSAMRVELDEPPPNDDGTPGTVRMFDLNHEHLRASHTEWLEPAPGEDWRIRNLVLAELFSEGTADEVVGKSQRKPESVPGAGVPILVSSRAGKVEARVDPTSTGVVSPERLAEIAEGFASPSTAEVWAEAFAGTTVAVGEAGPVPSPLQQRLELTDARMTVLAVEERWHRPCVHVEIVGERPTEDGRTHARYDVYIDPTATELLLLEQRFQTQLRVGDQGTSRTIGFERREYGWPNVPERPHFEVARRQGVDAPVDATWIDHDGRTLATVSGDRLRLWSLAQRRPVVEDVLGRIVDVGFSGPTRAGAGAADHDPSEQFVAALSEIGLYRNYRLGSLGGAVFGGGDEAQPDKRAVGIGFVGIYPIVGWEDGTLQLSNPGHGTRAGPPTPTAPGLLQLEDHPSSGLIVTRHEGGELRASQLTLSGCGTIWAYCEAAWAEVSSRGAATIPGAVDLAITADGSEVVVATVSGELWTWEPGHEPRRRAANTGHSVQSTPEGVRTSTARWAAGRLEPLDPRPVLTPVPDGVHYSAATQAFVRVDDQRGVELLDATRGQTRAFGLTPPARRARLVGDELLALVGNELWTWDLGEWRGTKLTVADSHNPARDLFVGDDGRVLVARHADAIALTRSSGSDWSRLWDLPGTVLHAAGGSQGWLVATTEGAVWLDPAGKQRARYRSPTAVLDAAGSSRGIMLLSRGAANEPIVTRLGDEDESERVPLPWADSAWIRPGTQIDWDGARDRVVLGPVHRLDGWPDHGWRPEIGVVVQIDARTGAIRQAFDPLWDSLHDLITVTEPGDDGLEVVVGIGDRGISRWDTRTGRQLLSYRHEGGHALSLDPAGTGVLATTHDGGFEWIDPFVPSEGNFAGRIDAFQRLVLEFHELPRRRRERARFYPGADELIATLPDAYYRAGRSELLNLNVRSFGANQDFETADLLSNRPDVIAARLGVASSEQRAALRAAYDKRRQRAGRLATRHVLLGFAAAPVLSTDAELVELEVRATRATASEDRKLTRLYAVADSTPVFGPEGLALTGTSAVETLRIPLRAGDNRIQIWAMDDGGGSSQRLNLVVTSTRAAPKPELFFVGIGVSDYADDRLDLEFAARDVETLAAALTGGPSFRGHRSLLLTDADVRHDADVLGRVEQFVAPAGVDDVVVVFLAGHGFLTADLDYYFGTQDIDPMDPAARGLAYDDIDGLLGRLVARRRVLLMDTCFSGETDEDMRVRLGQLPPGASVRGLTLTLPKPATTARLPAFELMRALFTTTDVGSGAVVVSAAGGAEFSFETKALQGGAFTTTLARGLAGEADLDRDGVVSIADLRRWLPAEVQAVTGGGQTPTIRQDNVDLDIPLR
jgi:hypothetical protein